MDKDQRMNKMESKMEMKTNNSYLPAIIKESKYSFPKLGNSQISSSTRSCAMPVRNSIGIILIRENSNTRQLEASVICRRNTYYFDAFALGKYNVKKDKTYVEKMFNNMTLDEQLDIYTLDFKKIWWRFCLKTDEDESYCKRRDKFMSQFMEDKGEKLRHMLKNSKPIDKLPYEIPKGRKKSKTETNEACAVREFEEETGIKKSHYIFLPFKYRRFDHIAEGVKYRNIYYIAFLTENIEPKVTLKSLIQVSEVKSVNWMNIDNIRKIDYPDRRIELLVEPVFGLIKKTLHAKCKFIEP
jgi:ADP-ribose pyrophosphatase YjhB (NUDIX family)